MFASFHSKGTILSCSDMSNTCASGLLTCSTVSFSILGDNPSTPGDLVSFILVCVHILYVSAILEVVNVSNCVKHYTMIVFQT